MDDHPDGARAISTEDALRRAARDLTAILAVIDPADERHDAVVSAIGDVAATFRQAAELA